MTGDGLASVTGVLSWLIEIRLFVTMLPEKLLLETLMLFELIVFSKTMSE